MLKRGLGASIAGARPPEAANPLLSASLLRCSAKKRMFMPMTRVYEVSTLRRLFLTGLVNLRRFEQHHPRGSHRW